MKIAKLTAGANPVPMGDLAPSTLAFLRRTAPAGVTYERAQAVATAPAGKRPHRKTSITGEPPPAPRPYDVHVTAPTGDVAEPSRGLA